MRSTVIVALALGSTLVPGLALAGAGNVGPALRERAEAVCRDDALRLCADAVPDETAIVACIRPKRALLTPPCRRIFDEVLREMRR